MKVNIERAIKSITEEIGFFQPLYESIVNSFHAEANKLYISFDVDRSNIINGYTIKDNGEGFKNRNIESFLTLWDDHKVEKGALGSGRILCLKVFNIIDIESQTKDNNTTKEKAQFTKIRFSKDFDKNTIDEVAPTENQSQESYTITKFENISENFKGGDAYFDIKKIKENILINLLPMFIRFDEEKIDFEIYINNNIWLNQQSLSQTIQDYNFQNKSFTIDGCEFKLTYRIKKDEKNNIQQFYGASDRKVKDFPDKRVKIEKLENNASGMFCLTSAYFEDKVKDSRKDFTFTTKNSPSDEFPILFKDINPKLNILLSEVILETFPSTKNNFNNIKTSISNKYPHLSDYLKNINNITLSENKIIKQAEQEFNKKKIKAREESENFVSKILQNRNFDENRFKEIQADFNQTGKEMLADYIGYRETIIQMLQEVDKTNLEKDIHNLFMPISTTSNDSSKYANNTWIFDDKFMSYNYAASNKGVKQILKDSNIDTDNMSDYDNKEIDLLMFYSEEKGIKDVVIIEFKKLGGGYFDKNKAISQLKLYPSIIKKYDKEVRSVFAYTILDFDEELRYNLENVEGFDPYYFGDMDNNISGYYFYNNKLKSHLNVVSFKQILNDASKRNNVFLNVLRQKFE